MTFNDFISNFNKGEFSDNDCYVFSRRLYLKCHNDYVYAGESINNSQLFTISKTHLLKNETKETTKLTDEQARFLSKSLAYGDHEICNKWAKYFSLLAKPTGVALNNAILAGNELSLDNNLITGTDITLSKDEIAIYNKLNPELLPIHCPPTQISQFVL